MNRLLELPNRQRRAIEIIREVSDEKDLRPFLVGGPVRDLLLGRESIDIDLTLEDGASTFARAFAKRVNGRVRSYPQFLTYKVTAEEFPQIDITTARKERYRKPGALPTVTAGRLKDDLLRRDFSVNAIAIEIESGDLFDPLNGARDIEQRQIRVLHPASFIDDPTRVLRAIRLASRLDFHFEAETEQLMAAAVEQDAFSTVTRERLWREMFLAMDEDDAPQVLAEFERRGVLEPILGAVTPQVNIASLRSVRERLASDDSLDRYVLYTGALLKGTEAVAEQLEGSGLSQKRAKNVLQIARDLNRIEETLSQVKSERQRFRVYRAVSPEMLTVITADLPSEGPHVARYREFRKFTLPLRGNDLEVPAGPHIAKALERTREAVFSGEIPPEQARAYARDVAMKLLTSDRRDSNA